VTDVREPLRLADPASWDDESDAGATVGEIISRFAREQPDVMAVRDAATTLTYAAFDEATDRLAQHLRALGVGHEHCVAVACHRSVEALVAFVGILKAGAAFVPVDPDDPEPRLRFMLDDTDARAIVCRPGREDAVTQFGLPVVVLTPDLDAPADGAVGEVCVPAPSSLAYVMYTSGSTGRPKGVAIEHGNIVARVRGATALMPRAGEAMLQVSELDFDANTWEIWGALLNGAGLVIAPPGRPDPAAVAALLASANVNVALLSPGLFHQMVEHDVGALARLRLLLVGGDVMSPTHARRFVDANPDVPLVNLYGPTEVTVCCTWYEVVPLPPGTAVPIGRPLGNTTLHVFGADGGPVEPGGTGELFIGGPAVGRGYLNLPEPTAERFVPDPSSPRASARLYRTGDLVRRRDDGDLDFVGRIDNQLKIRGFRIEPGEIEAALHGIAGVRRAAVIGREDVPGHKRLVAYLVGDGAGLSVDSVRDALAATLPPHLVPSAFVVLDELPLTSRGKVDVSALPPPGGDAARRPPSTPTEVDVARIWADVLHLDEVGADDDFIEQGGDSLLAVRILASIESAFGVALPITAVLEAGSVAALARRVDEARVGGPSVQLPPLVPTDSRDALPVTRAQAIACLASEMAVDALPYQFQAVIHFRGQFDHAVLDRVLTEIVRRHEILRTRFPVRDGRWVQEIDEPYDVRTPLIDLVGAPDPDRAWQTQAEQAYGTRIPIDELPLVRWTVLRPRPDHHVLVHVEHHLVHDGASWALLLGEIAVLYRAFAAGEPSPLPELTVQYRDFTRWQDLISEHPIGARQLGYWRETLAALPPPLQLPTDRPRPPGQTYRGEQLSVDLDEGLVFELRALARQQGVTMFVLMFAAFDALLGRLSGQTDIIVGSGVANRRVAGTEQLIGMVLNTVALRVDLSGDPAIEELVRRARETTMRAFENQDVPFERIVEEVQPERRPGELPIYQTLFSFQDPVLPDLTLDGVEMEPDDTPSNGSAKADLNVVVLSRRSAHEDCRPPTAEITVLWEYASDLFDRETAHAMLHRYVAVLRAMVADPTQRLSRLPLLDETEQSDALASAGAARPYERDASIPAVLAAQVRATPHTVAVVAGDEQWTYEELWRRAGAVAARLAQSDVGAGDAVAVLMDRGPAAVAALVGSLTVGGAYVALDPTHPPARLLELLAICDPVAVCTDAANSALARSVAGARPVIVVDQIEGLPESGWAIPSISPAARAYIAFTSGSTGGAKGVEVPHRAVLRLVRNQEYVSLGPHERVLAFAPLAFDASTFEIWGALLNGGALVVAPPGPLSPNELEDVVTTGQVTTMWLTAGLFHQVVDVCPSLFTRVRQVLAGGDVLSPGHVNAALGLLPAGGVLVNGYGPTEGTTFTCCHRMDAGSTVSGSVPIGVPIANTRVYVLDEHRQPVPEGVAGELYVGGDGVALGYVGQPELTRERFVPDPFDGPPHARMYRTGDLVRRRNGLLEFIGRVDDQVKIRGFRVEPAEVEHALSAISGVRDAAVVVHRDQEASLAAFVVLAPETTVDAVRDALRQRLPAYLVPERWRQLDALPLTANGKVDRGALPEVEVTSREGAGDAPAARPLSTLEQRLVEIWQDVLGVHPVAVDDDFFELGGHSLRAVELFASIERIIGPRLPLSTIFEASTVAELAQRMRAEGWEAPWSPVVPLRAAGRGLPFFCLSAGDGNTVGYGALGRRLRADQRFYALQPRGLDGRRPLHTSVEAMAEHYLRAIREVQPEGPYLLGGRCLGGLVAYEMACQLERAGERVALLAVLDSLGPRWKERRLGNGLVFDEVMNLALVAARREHVDVGDVFAAGDADRFTAWLQEPVVTGDVVVNRYLHQAYAARPDVQSAYPNLHGADAARLVDWAWVSGRREMGLNEHLLPPATDAAKELVAPREPRLRRLAERGADRVVDWVDVGTRGRVQALAQRRQHRLQLIASAAANRYRAGAYDGIVTLVRTDEFRDDIEIARWHGIETRGVVEVPVTGTHRSMLREPDVAALAEALQDCIDEAVRD
jgi:amino acid adenylation domain-containing protein